MRNVDARDFCVPVVSPELSPQRANQPVDVVEVSGSNVLKYNVMPRAGVEPAWAEAQGILSPLCLPIPPPGPENETCPPATTYASLARTVSLLKE